MLDNVPDDNVPDLARRVARRAANHPGHVIAVTNEVGLGVVPMNRLTRRYVELLGAVNRIWVESAAQALLVVAGRAIELPSPRHTAQAHASLD
jgi:adenosylcobinamide kinase / adenosylcobinamide-phosphate guanylyltransferase